VVVEPACGASLAVASDPGRLAGFANVLVIVCGGVTATVAQLQAWAAHKP
jgi:L-serine/L-threonine ammonia-lyase